MQRSNLSTLLNDLVMEGKLEKLQGRPVPYRIANRPGSGSSEESCFKELLGYNGSLKNVTRLAKAAILYSFVLQQFQKHIPGPDRQKVNMVNDQYSPSGLLKRALTIIAAAAKQLCFFQNGYDRADFGKE